VHTTITETARYGTATASSWDRVHPRLTHRGCWLGHDGALPVIEGTLIRLQVDHLPRDRDPKPVWLWSSATGVTAADVDRRWQAFLRRFDLEHTFRLFKQTLGWTVPKIRTPQARPVDLAGRRRLHAAASRSSAGRRPAPTLGETNPAGPADTGPGPARVSEPPPAPHPACPRAETLPTRSRTPQGSKNAARATHHDVGKTTTRDRTMTAHRNRTG
jgi:hypothetical protein